MTHGLVRLLLPTALVGIPSPVTMGSPGCAGRVDMDRRHPRALFRHLGQSLRASVLTAWPDAVQLAVGCERDQPGGPLAAVHARRRACGEAGEQVAIDVITLIRLGEEFLGRPITGLLPLTRSGSLATLGAPE